MNLTGLSYAIAILIATIGIFGIWHPNEISSWWRILAACWILLLLFEWRISRRIKFICTRTIKPTIHLGRHSELAYRIHNKQPYILQLRTLDNYPANVAEAAEIAEWKLAKNASDEKIVSITPTKLGELGWQNIQSRIRGHFGLAWWSRSVTVDTTTTVIPDRLYNHEVQKTATAHQGDIARRIMGIGSELIGLREYIPGDPLHYIDWKASARGNKTMVRLFSDEQHLELMIVIDAGRTSSMQAGVLTRLDHYINIASRLAQKAMLNGDQVGIIVFADSVLASMHRLKGHHGLQRLRKILGQIKAVPRESNPLPAIMRVKQLASLRSLVVMLTDLDDGDAAAQLVKALNLLQPKHQPMLAAISDEDIQKLSQQNAINWIDPYNGLAAYEMIQNWRHTRVRLERMGVPVVLSGIKHLDKQVLENYDMLKEHRRI